MTRSLIILFVFITFLSCTKSETGSGTTEQETSTNTSKTNLPDMENFDWQGHRGARGLMPENSIEGFLKALEYPVKTLELDVVISKDNKVILSHEPWFSPEICLNQDGEPLEEGSHLKIINYTAEEIKDFDCGSKGNSRFIEQETRKTYKPELIEVVNVVERFCERTKKEKPFYNIELKSKAEWDGEFTPKPEIFVQLVLEELERLRILERTTIQSFDMRILNELNRQYPKVSTAILVDEGEKGKEKMAELDFQPDIYSCYHKMLSKKEVAEWQAKGMKVIPWTVNEINDMRALLIMGVDGIITDYPNRIEIVLNAR